MTVFGKTRPTGLPAPIPVFGGPLDGHEIRYLQALYPRPTHAPVVFAVWLSLPRQPDGPPRDHPDHQARECAHAMAWTTRYVGTCVLTVHEDRWGPAARWGLIGSWGTEQLDERVTSCLHEGYVLHHHSLRDQHGKHVTPDRYLDMAESDIILLRYTYRGQWHKRRQSQTARQ